MRHPDSQDNSGVWALKEWQAVVDAVASGDCHVLLRKGGVHEAGFRLPTRRAWLLPTHIHAPEAGPGLTARAGAEDQRTPPMRCRVTVLDALSLAGPLSSAVVAELSALSHLPTDALRRRLTLRPDQALIALVVHATVTHEPFALPWHKRYGGCRSWVPLHMAPGVEPPVDSVLAPHRARERQEDVRARLAALAQIGG